MTRAASKSKACPRAWEIEAARDGRLLPKDLESLERHVATCAGCQQQRRRLNTLSEALVSLPPLADDMLAARRTRYHLLSEFDRGIVEAPGSRWQRARPWVCSAAAAVVLSAAALLVVHARAVRSPSRALAPSPRSANAAVEAVKVDVTAQSGSVWRKLQLGDELRLELDAGEIGARIGKRRPGQSVYIRLPDGQIDDLGTVLSVRVEQSHTTSVHVSEGRVRLRLDGRPPIELGPGESWSSSPTLGLDARSGSAAKPARLVASVGKRLPVPSTSLSAQRGLVADAAPAASTTTATPPINSTSSRQAREEDDAYLQIVTLARQHRMEEARTAAKAYLMRFPNGFRREEVLGVATAPQR